MPHTGDAGRTAMPAASDHDKDRSLREDTRLLGRILGDTVREQQGERVFDIIEEIRQTSIRFRRDGDEAARRELGEIMDRLSHGEASQIIRAFGFANIAKDQHRIRRTRAHAIAGSPPRDGSMTQVLARARDAAADRALEALSRRRPGGRCRRRHSHDDKRHRRWAAQQRLEAAERLSRRTPNENPPICRRLPEAGSAPKFAVTPTVPAGTGRALF